jgi:hypothetical protein
LKGEGGSNLDERVRGIIESKIDFVLKHNIVPDVEFVKGVVPLKSFADCVLGYALGLLKQQSYFILISLGRLSESDKRDVDKIIERRIPEIREKIIQELNQ